MSFLNRFVGSSAMNTDKSVNFFARLVSILSFMLFCRILMFCVFGLTNPHGLFGVFDNYDLSYYALNYDNGLIVRGLAGALFGDLFLSFGKNVPIYLSIMKILYEVVFFVMLIYVASKYKNKDVQMIAMIAAMFIRPFYLNGMGMYVIKTDIFWYTCMIPIVLLLWSDSVKHFNLKMIGVLLCSAIAMLFHQVFIFIFAPLVCLILLDKKQIMWFLIYGVTLCCLFVVLIEFCAGDYDTICDQVISNLKKSGVWYYIEDDIIFPKTDDGIPTGIFYEYGLSRSTQLYESETLMHEYMDVHLPFFIFEVLFCLFSIMTTASIIAKYCKQILLSKFKTTLVVLIITLPFVVLALFTIDIDRWFLMTLTSLNVFAIYVAVKHNIRLDINLKSFNTSCIVNTVFFPIFCMYS